jgi:hypothetical protein
MCGFADRCRCGMQARLTTNMPRVLIDCIRLAPSRAARTAMAGPMPRLPPEMNKVLPARVIVVFLKPGAGGAPRIVRVIELALSRNASVWVSFVTVSFAQLHGLDGRHAWPPVVRGD